MRATRTLPPNYQKAGSIDISNNRRLLVILNMAGMLLMVFFGWIFFRAMVWLRPADALRLAGSASIEGLLEWVLLFAAIFALMALHIVVHEAVHGLFFWIYTGNRPRFAFKGAYAYAAMPGWYIPRGAFFITTLAPFVVISLIGLLMMRLTPWLLPIWFVITLNASGSAGDLLVAAWLLLQPPGCLAEDRGDAVTLYLPEKMPLQPSR